MSHGMPLDLLSPARHAATEMERVAPAALSVSDLAETYHHPNTGDVSRVRVRAGVQSEHDVNCWLIEQALEKLQYRGSTTRSTVQLVNDDGKWRFADGIIFDDLEWDKKKLVRVVNLHKVLNDPFDKMTGAFSDNIRALGKLEDLRESMETLGWVDDPIFEALVDENGVVLVGHRRMAVAKELGIEPRTRTVFCGSGDEADLKRFQLALASNIGRKDMSPGERQNIVKVLAGPNHDWTQMSIAAALGVSRQQIGKDLAALRESGDLPLSSKSRQGGPGKPRNEMGRRPRTTGKPKRSEDPALLADIEKAIDAGEPVYPLGKKHNVSDPIIGAAVARVEGRREGRQESQPAADLEPKPEEPVISPAEMEKFIEIDKRIDAADAKLCTCRTCPVHGVE